MSAAVGTPDVVVARDVTKSFATAAGPFTGA